MQFDNASPIWLQLVAEFSRRIATGQWQPGQKIAGVRELAVDLAVNPNTVQRALAELEREEICYSVRTSGRFVTSDAKKIESLRQEMATAITEDFVMKTKGLSIDQAEAITLVNHVWSTTETKGMTGEQ